jgi:hypothetical protein
MFRRADVLSLSRAAYLLSRFLTIDIRIQPKFAINFNIEQPTAMYDAHHWWLTALKARSEHASSK